MFAADGALGHPSLTAPSAEGPGLFGSTGLFVGLVVLAVVVIVWSAVRSHRQMRELREHIAACGWRPVERDEPMPRPVASAVRSRRTKLAVAAEEPYPLWLVWHRWTESQGTGDSRRTSTHDLTRYFLRPGGGFRDVEVVKRTAIGGFLMPVRGVGTGDAAFDKRFLIRGLGEQQAVRLLTPALRAAMLAGDVPPWEVAGGVLISAYTDAPSIGTFQPRADALVRLAGMLTDPTTA
ncbi:hypothetical protein [Actinomadura montaniterrae]|uniref:Uncharacterized protein n=1 Tax=Actinomadura montaniterrae TaxID=1803903 RepID=A0A6L3VP31_9ACTN|nr:hypothetical protein [Actinomadura montaniterrae]KAB2373212.1 hypothetical protein F9B16_28930 [Actinomadura montaniterrae]